MKSSDPSGPSGVYFDDSCQLCMRAVQFIGKHSKSGQFKFIPLQEATENQIPGIRDIASDSLVLIHNNKMLTESEAVLRLAGKLKFPWNLLQVFLVIPAKWRNALYRVVARNRHAFDIGERTGEKG